MLSIVILCVLIAVTVASILVLVSIDNKRRGKKADELVARFFELGERNNLSFTNKEIVEHFIIGLDELRRKLFVLTSSDKKYDLQVIDLKEANSCSSKDIYENKYKRDAKGQKFESRLDRIVLEFNYTDKREPIQIPFYEAGVNRLQNIPGLRQKAMSWEIILTRTINKGVKRTA